MGAKGDLKHQVEVGNLERSYHTLGNDQEMCSLCLAGTSDVPFTDTNDEPLWATTLYNSRPWTTTPCLKALQLIWGEMQLIWGEISGPYVSTKLNYISTADTSESIGSIG